VAVFYIILRHKAVVLDPLFGEEVYGVGFLQKGITDVFFIPQNCADIAGMPPFTTRAIQNAVRFQSADNFQHTCKASKYYKH
jgi:hypothetical protein